MNIDKLKNKILQLAIQGKLVEQDENDESAKILYEKIQEEKEKLIKEKKIRRVKVDEIGKDDIPFEIPRSWKWVRLGDVGDWGAGLTPLRMNKKFYEDGIIPWIKTGELNDGYIINVEEKISQYALSKTSIRLNNPGDILIAMYGATIGRLGIVTEISATNQACCACKLYNYNYNLYLFYYLLSQRQNFRDQGEGGAQPNISRTKIINYLYPLPPLNEQKRIVEKIDELFKIVDKLNNKKEDILKIIERTRENILTKAIQGKLIVQDENDESAEVLYEKIQEEKKQLIKEKKIRKENLEKANINDINFKLPNNWSLIKMGDIAQYRRGPFGSSITKSMFVEKTENTAKIYEQGNAIRKNVNYGNYYITESKFKELEAFKVSPGDILISCAGTIGETYILPEVIEKGIINQALMRVQVSKLIEKRYFLMYFDYILESDIQSASKGSAIKNIPPMKVLKNITMPLPPLNEQKSILNKIDKSMDYLDEIESIMSGGY